MAEANGLTVFGATLLELMVRRGLTQWKELSDLLQQDRGYHYSPQSISNWAFGKHPADKTFGKAAAEALNLDDEETTKLARAFMLGQNVPVKMPVSAEPKRS